MIDESDAFNSEKQIFGDRLTLYEVAELLAGLGNHEGKCLVLLYLNQHPYYQSNYQMGKGFRSFLGPNPDWSPHLYLPFNYCENSFAPLGQVVKGVVETQHGLSPAYTITERGKDLGVPLAGLLLDWSLRYPDISVQQLLGSTHSKGESRAPENRLQVIMDVLTAKKEGISISDIATLNPEDWADQGYKNRISNISAAVLGLKDAGIITTEHAIDYNSREFKIINPVPPEMSRGRTLIMDFVYEFMANCIANGKDLFAYGECLEFVISSIREKGIEMDAADIRNKLTSVLDDKKTLLPGLVRLGSFNDGSLTKIYANSDHIEALNEFSNIILGIDSQDPNFMANGRLMAQRIVNDPNAIRLLISKAKRFSSAANKISRKESGDELYQLLVDNGGALDAESIRILYSEKYKRVLSIAGVQAILRMLTDEGRITTEKDRLNPSVLKKKNYYRPVIDRVSEEDSNTLISV